MSPIQLYDGEVVPFAEDGSNLMFRYRDQKICSQCATVLVLAGILPSANIICKGSYTCFKCHDIVCAVESEPDIDLEEEEEGAGLPMVLLQEIVDTRLAWSEYHRLCEKYSDESYAWGFWCGPFTKKRPAQPAQRLGDFAIEYGHQNGDSEQEELDDDHTCNNEDSDPAEPSPWAIQQDFGIHFDQGI